MMNVLFSKVIGFLSVPQCRSLPSNAAVASGDILFLLFLSNRANVFYAVLILSIFLSAEFSFLFSGCGLRIFSYN